MCSLGPLFFPTKVSLFRRGQAAVISDTDNHVALAPFSQTPQCPYLDLTMSLCFGLSWTHKWRAVPVGVI